MHATLNSEFLASGLTGVVVAASVTGARVAFYLKSHSGFTRTDKGQLAVIYPGGGSRLVDMLLAIHPDYQAPEILDSIRIAAFKALAIPDDATWRLSVAPRCTIEFQSEHIEDGHFELL